MVILAIFALGMVGVLLVLAASAAPAAPLASVPLVSPQTISFEKAAPLLASGDAIRAIVADTGSMEPVLVAWNQVLEIVPQSPSEVSIGDIITYSSTTKGVTIIHRVVGISSDDFGWYATTKGDNSPNVDNEQIRFPMIKGVVVAIIE